MPGIDLSMAGPTENSPSGKPAKNVPEDWADEDFREAFESLRIPNEMVHHREHIRLAWIYSRQFPQEEALVRGSSSIITRRPGFKAMQRDTAGWIRIFGPYLEPLVGGQFPSCP